MTTVAADVQANIAKFDAAADRAEEKWSSALVKLNSYVGGMDPALVLGSIREVKDRAVRWRARGVALAAGKPLQLDNVNTDPVTHRTDTYGAWVELGNELIHELQTTAEDATNDSIVSAVTVTASETAGTIEHAAVSTADTVGKLAAWVEGHRTLLIIVAVPLVALWLLAQFGLLGLFVRRPRDA